MSKGRQKSTFYDDNKMPRGVKNILDDPTQQKIAFTKKSGINLNKMDPQTNPEGDTKLPPKLIALYDYCATPDNLFEEETDLNGLKHLVEFFKNKGGNSLWEYWNQDEFAERWGLDCMHYNDNFIDPPEPQTWEDYACQLMEQAENDLGKLDGIINDVLDYTKMADAGSQEEETQWKTRMFLYGISNHDPLIIFGFVEGTDDQLQNHYWDKAIESNPVMKFKNRPLSTIWLMTCAKFEYPWTPEEFNGVVDEWNDLQEREAEFQANLAAHKAKKRSAIGSPDRLVNSKQRPKVTPQKDDDDDEKMDNPTDEPLPSSDAEMDKINRKKRQADDDAAIELRDDDDDAETEVEILDDEHKLDENGPANQDMLNLSVDDDDDQHKAADSLSDSDDDEDIDDDDGIEEVPAKNQAKSQKQTRFAKNSPSSKTKQHSPLKPSPTQSPPSSATPPPKQHSTPKQDEKAIPDPPNIDRRPDSYANAARLPETVLSDEQKVRRLVQVNIEGLPFKTVAIFKVTAFMPWQGLENEQAVQDTENKNVRVVLENRMANLLKKAISEAMNETSCDLTLLPIADGNYKKSRYWVKSAKALKNFTCWAHFRDYVDASGTSNAYWFHKKPEEARDRRLRIRMRFGFNIPIDVLRPVLHTFFQLNASGTVYESKLQYGSISWVGFLPYYSLQTNEELLARQIMMILGFKIPIAVEERWSSSVETINPNKKPERLWKYGNNSPTYFHIVTPTAYAKQVDRKLSEIFSIERSVPKNQYPWGSPSQYIHDAKMCRDGQLSISWSSEVKMALTRQLDTAKAFLLISETIRCPIKLTGMLKQAHLSNFGEDDGSGHLKPQSLLKVLWSIKCTPEAVDNSASDEEIQKDDYDTATPTEETSELTGDTMASPSFGRRQLTPQERAQRDRAIAKLQKQDAARTRPSALFILIAPSAEDGFWIFTVRKKYAPLARRILDDLPAFLIYYLAERTVENENVILRKWMSFSAVTTSRERGMVWNPATLRATSEVEATEQMNLDLGFSFMQGLELDDPLEDDFSGKVELDLTMADVKAIDEGATIAGVLNEARRLQAAQQELDEAYSKIEQQKRDSQEKARQLAARDKELAELKAQVAKFQQMEVSIPSQEKPKQRKPRHKKKQKGAGNAGSGGGSSATRP